MVGQTIARCGWPWSIVCCLASILFAPSLAEARERIVVYTLRAPPPLQSLAERLTEAMLVHLASHGDFEVIGEAEVDLIVGHLQDRADLSSEDCKRAEECLAKLARTVDADRVLAGRVGKLGESFVVTLSLMDSTQTAVARSESCSAEGEEELAAALLRATSAILGDERTEQSRRLELVENRRGAKVIVMPLVGLEQENGAALSLTQILALELRRAGLEVVTRDEVEAMVDRAILAHECAGKEDDLVACLTEIGGALGVDYLSAGAIGRFDETYVIVLKLIDLSRVTVLNRISESYRGPGAQLPRAMRFAAQALLGRELEGAGDLELISDVTGRLTIDGGEANPLPLSRAISALPAGKHTLMILSEDHLPYHAELFVEPGLTTRFEPVLIERPVPWYSSWWFWTAVGAVAAAGTATTLVLLDAPATGDGDWSIRR